MSRPSASLCDARLDSGLKGGTGVVDLVIDAKFVKRFGGPA